MNPTQTFGQARLIISMSLNGRDNWQMVKPEDVPAFIKDPDTMAKLVAGQMACNPRMGDKGSAWYIADRVADPVTLAVDMAIDGMTEQ